MSTDEYCSIDVCLKRLNFNPQIKIIIYDTLSNCRSSMRCKSLSNLSSRSGWQFQNLQMISIILTLSHNYADMLQMTLESIVRKEKLLIIKNFFFSNNVCIYIQNSLREISHISPNMFLICLLHILSFCERYK